MATKRSALPDLAVAKVKRFCDQKIPEHVRDQLVWVVETRGRSIMIYENRPPWREDFGPEWSKREIARFLYDPDTMTWTLYWANRHGRWLKVPDAPPADDVEPLLRIVQEDRTGAFE
ncbi:MAG: DUF3024 domain-containing protein [Actinomycetota bacterium]